MENIKPHTAYTWQQEERNILNFAINGPMDASLITHIKCSFLYVNVRREVENVMSYDLPVHNFAVCPNHSSAIEFKWETLAEFAQLHRKCGPTEYVMEEIGWFYTPDQIPADTFKYEIQKWAPQGVYVVPHCLPLLEDLNEIFIVMREEVPVLSNPILKKGGEMQRTKRVHFATATTHSVKPKKGRTTRKQHKPNPININTQSE